MTRFKDTFTWLISGLTGYANTVLCARFLRHLDALCTDTDYQDIFWCFSDN
jgi:hypothetical protein